jgi:hypothetical protein
LKRYAADGAGRENSGTWLPDFVGSRGDPHCIDLMKQMKLPY